MSVAVSPVGPRSAFRRSLVVALPLLGLVLLAGFLRWREVQQQTVVSEDAAYFLLVYRSLLNGQPFAGLAEGLAAWPPLYPLLTFGVSWLSRGDLEAAAHGVTAGAGVLLVLLMFWLGQRLAGTAVGLLAAGLTAVCPSLVAISGLTYGDMLYALLCTAAYLGLVTALQQPCPPRRTALLIGLAFGLAYLCRPEALLLLVLAAAWVAVGRAVGGGANSRGRRYHWGAAGVMIVTFVVVVAPYGVALRRVSGTWQVAKLTYNLRLGLEPVRRPALDESGALRPSTAPEPAAAYVRSHLRGLVGKYIRNSNEVLALQLPRLGGVVLWTLFGAGLVGGRLPWRRETLALATMAAPLLLLPLFIVGQLRFYAWLGPLFMLGAAAGTADLADRVRRLSGRPHRPVLLAGGVLAMVLTALPLVRYPPREAGLYDAFRQTGERILRARGPGQLVLSEDCWVPFYARGRYLETPVATPATLARYVAAEGVQFVVVDTELVGGVPALRPLLDPRQAPAGWRVFDREEKPGAYRMIVYEVPRARSRRAASSSP